MNQHGRHPLREEDEPCSCVYTLGKAGNAAVPRVLEALGSRDQEPLAELMLFQRVTAPQILRVVKCPSTA